jgi:hypothetical protein
MRFEFVDQGWERKFRKALEDSNGSVRIICPFIQSRPVQLLLEAGRPKRFEVITRYNLDDFASGVSDPSALRTLLEHGAHIRGIRGLHAKLYVIGDCAMVTSANLTEKGLHDNHEFGIVTRDPRDVLECNRYFDILWHKVGQKDLTLDKVGEWESVILAYKSGVGSGSKLGDEGAIVWPTSDEESPESERGDINVEFSPGEQAFVKFFGNDSAREPTSLPVKDEIHRSGSHWALTYAKRPTGVSNGALMFMSRLVRDPHDIVIYGRATGTSHVPGRDDATAADLERRPWKSHWQYYIRVTDPEFIAGTLENGIQLSRLKATFGSNAFATTKANAAKGIGNTDPNRAYLQQPAVRLTPEAASWLSEQFEMAAAKHGRLRRGDLLDLDWPPVPA